MSAINIDGNKIAQDIEAELRVKVSKMSNKPRLSVVQVGEDPASTSYIKAKSNAAERVGIQLTHHHLPVETTESELSALVSDLNSSENGIIVQLPLPKGLEGVLSKIDPAKDVDGFHPMNVGNLSSGYESSVPCTPLGCYLLIKKIEPNLNGKKAVIVGRSNLNGKPMTQLLLKENCTVTITHSKTCLLYTSPSPRDRG